MTELGARNRGQFSMSRRRQISWVECAEKTVMGSREIRFSGMIMGCNGVSGSQVYEGGRNLWNDWLDGSMESKRGWSTLYQRYLQVSEIRTRQRLIAHC
jgi:hypothetical protein